MVVVLPDPFRGMGAWEARMRDSQGGGESDPAEGVRRRCIKNSPFVLSCIGKRTKEGCVSEVETFTADKTRKDQFLRGNRRNLTGEGVVRKSSSPQRVASVSNLCNSRRQGTWVMESIAPFWQANEQHSPLRTKRGRYAPKVFIPRAPIARKVRSLGDGLE